MLLLSGLPEKKIHQLQFSINEQLDTAIKNNIDFDVSRTPEGIQCMELQDLINKLQEEARAKNKSKVPEQTSLKDKGKGKKPTDSFPSPVSEEEKQETAPFITKRKRSNPTSRARSSSAPQTSPNPTMVVTSQGATLKNDIAPSPDEEIILRSKNL